MLVLKNLDLSWNLLHDFSELIRFTMNYTRLDTLKIEYALLRSYWVITYKVRGNRFDPKTIAQAAGIQHSVKHLSMNLTLMTWDQVSFYPCRVVQH